MAKNALPLTGIGLSGRFFKVTVYVYPKLTPVILQLMVVGVRGYRGNHAQSAVMVGYRSESASVTIPHRHMEVETAAGLG